MINTDKYLPAQLPTNGLHSSGKLLVRTGKTGTDIDGAGKGYFGVDYVLSVPKTAKASSGIWARIKALFGLGQTSTKNLEKCHVQWVKVQVQDDKHPDKVATVYLNAAQINGTDRRGKKPVKLEPEIPAPVAALKPKARSQASTPRYSERCHFVGNPNGIKVDPNNLARVMGPKSASPEYGD